MPGMEWARDLAAMCQVSLVGYAVGGAFLNLTYFDLPYYIVVISIILQGLVRQELVATQNP
jgi:putative inorganic carbon (hco3(-)) transporter